MTYALIRQEPLFGAQGIIESGDANSIIVNSDDGPDSQYFTSENIDCLDEKNEFEPQCWTLLNIASWLPKWFKVTPECKPGTESDCNIKKPSR